LNIFSLGGFVGTGRRGNTNCFSSSSTFFTAFHKRGYLFNALGREVVLDAGQKLVQLWFRPGGFAATFKDFMHACTVFVRRLRSLRPLLIVITTIIPVSTSSNRRCSLFIFWSTTFGAGIAPFGNFISACAGEFVSVGLDTITDIFGGCGACTNFMGSLFTFVVFFKLCKAFSRDGGVQAFDHFANFLCSGRGGVIQWLHAAAVLDFVTARVVGWPLRGPSSMNPSSQVKHNAKAQERL
jgi:hypothetical protein